jgi:cell division septal protein FtsQ
MQKQNDEKKENVLISFLREKTTTISNKVNAQIQRNPQQAKKYFLLIFGLLFAFFTSVLIIRLLAATKSVKNINTTEIKINGKK